MSLILVIAYVVLAVIGWRRPLLPDEIWGLLNGSASFTEQLESIRTDLVHPPLSQLILRLWINVAGDSDSSVRIFILLINIPTIVLFTRLAPRLTHHWRFAAFGFAVIFLQVGSIAHLARMYGMTVLLSVIAITLWDRWQRDPRDRVLASWAAVMLLLCYVHYSGLLLVGAFVVSAWLRGPRRLAVTVGGAAVTVGVLPWVLYSFPVYLNRGLAPNLRWITAEDGVVEILAKMPLYLLSRIPRGADSFGEVSWFEALGSARYPALAAITIHAVLLALAWTGYRARRTGRDSRRSMHDAGIDVSMDWLITSASLVIVPTVLLFFFSLGVYPALHPRFLFSYWPAYWILVASLVQLAGRPGEWGVRPVLVAWLCLSIASAAATGARSPLPRDVERLAEHSRSGDVVLVDGTQLGGQIFWEWTRRLGREEPVVVLGASLIPWNLPLHESVDSIDLESAQRVWLATLGGDARVATISRELRSKGFRTASEVAPYIRLFSRSVAAPWDSAMDAVQRHTNADAKNP